MEVISIHSCGYKTCPYVTITGKDVAKYALAFAAVVAVGYIIYKVS